MSLGGRSGAAGNWPGRFGLKDETAGAR